MRRPRGFAYMEVVAATALVGIAVLVAVSLTASTPRAARQVKASRVALEALENTMEGIRSGAAPLRLAATTVSRANGVVVRVDVRPTDVRGLHRVVVEASVGVDGRMTKRRVETLVWRQP